jgi:hypothetical protein
MISELRSAAPCSPRVSLFGKRPGNTGNALMNEKNPMMARV